MYSNHVHTLKSRSTYLTMQSSKSDEFANRNNQDFEFHKKSRIDIKPSSNESQIIFNQHYSSSSSSQFNLLLLLAPIFFLFATAMPHSPFSFIATAANAAIEDIFDPAKFNPVCHLSDVVYNFLKAFTGRYVAMSLYSTQYNTLRSKLLSFQTYS